MHTGLVSQSLPADVHQVILEIIVPLEPVSGFHHQLGSLTGIVGVIVVLHLRPAGSLEVMERGPSAEDALMRSLLVVSRRTVIDGVNQDVPGLQNILIGLAIAGLHIAANPFFLRELLRSPGQLTHQLKHHGVILRALHREADTLK